MNKKFLLLPILLALGLSACGGQPQSSQQSSIEEPVSSEPASSSSEEPAPSSVEPSSEVPSSEVPSSSIVSSAPISSAEPGEFVDYVHGETVKLDVDYKQKDFFTDGIGEVTLASNIDGDTAHFYPVVKTTSSEKIKIRFYGIDTPESTGKIQPYGHAASVFTSSKLDAAKANGTIVISTPGKGYKVPEKDSTGSRFLGLVWINETKKNANFDELVLLNLWIIQEGYSWINNLEKCPYFADTFMAVEAQSKAFKLNLFSGEDDPDFNYGDYESVSILDMKKEVELQLKDSTHKNKFNNSKVRINGTVAGFVNNTLYLEAFYTKEDGSTKDEGEWAGINVYCGMGTIPARYRTLNAVIMLCGTALDSDTFGFQISGVNFPTLKSRESDTTARVMIEADDNVDPETKLKRFEYTTAQLNTAVANNDYSALNCAVKVTDEFTVTDFYISDSNEITLYLNNARQNSTTNFVIYITFNYKGDPNDDVTVWKTKEQFVGKKFTVQGVYTFHKFTTGRISYQITPMNASDLVCTSL